MYPIGRSGFSQHLSGLEQIDDVGGASRNLKLRDWIWIDQTDHNINRELTRLRQ